MITAAQARALVEASDLEIDLCLEQISPMIETFAKGGLRALPLNKVPKFAFDERFSKHHVVGTTITTTEFHTRLFEKLSSHGYFVKWESQAEPYVPRGLADDDGNGPLHQHFSIVVRW
jgi:hypothetical protein